MSVVAALLRFLALFPISLLPERWRRELHEGDNAEFSIPAMLTGLGEIVLAVLLWWDRFAAFRAAAYNDTSAVGDGSYGAFFIYGATLYIGFFFTGWGVLALALFLEGFARLASGMLRLPVGLASLGLIDLALVARAERRARPPVGQPVPDQVTRGDGWDLSIATWRPRDWDALSTVRCEDELYQLVATEEHDPPRRWVYRLRRIAAEHLVRRVDDYVPDPGPPPKKK